jgi:hypothetical protein
MVAKSVPLRPMFRVGKSQKSLWARSEEYSGHFYVHVLERLRYTFRRKRRYTWQGEWFLHHDNAPSHTSLVVLQFLVACCAAIPRQKRFRVITQTPYSPDLALSDFWLFCTLKMKHKGTSFANMGDIKSNATAELRKIPKEALRRCFQHCIYAASDIVTL